MEHNWEYKRLGDVADVVGGSTPLTSEPSYWNGNYFWITPAELNGSKYYYSTERKLTLEGIHSAGLKPMPIGTVLLSSRAPIGKVGITKAEMYCNQGFKNIICGDTLYNEYVYYYLLHIKDYLQDIGNGPTFKEISKKVTENVKIPVPPMEVQEQIVAELDAISAMIEKNREVLRNLDALAQSLFYDTFGDPITNPKGWEVKELKTICDVRDGTHDSPKYVTSGIPLVTSKNLTSGIIDIATANHISVNDARNINKRSKVDYGDIMMPMIGTIGNPVINNVHDEFCIKNVALIKFYANKLINIYLLYILKSNLFKEYVRFNNRGATQKFLSLKLLRDFMLPVPPLALQEAFAQKIEAIEEQKAKVEAATARLQTLLDSRMDYWFN